ncbi:hypothetical protein OKA05_02075 [Luteolibacter arcticus]|uniref:Uncharacterized protein n=1 Tax=Luteolibacter arcticus TaxID=1581411 RepID=A0ABT3GDE3_9BACT|nr:hypothetical protein [Luteolibacter arcticus]MCW1921320.1 hypothetical protein [Luteolibacter arcticus]
MVNAKIDTRPLEEAVAEFSRAGRKGLDGAMKDQGGILVGHVIAITPPGGKRGEAMSERGGIDLTAKKRGESRIAADIAAIFPTTKAPEAEVQGWIRAGVKVKATKHSRAVHVRDIAFTTADLKRVHQVARNRQTGRTRAMGGDNMAYTRSNLLKAYIRQEIKRVGLLNRGWLTAAETLGTSKRNTPAWITRHGRQGGAATVLTGRGRTLITISNFQAWFPSGMDGRIQLALRRREAGLKKATEAILERQAKAAERRMGR